MVRGEITLKSKETVIIEKNSLNELMAWIDQHHDDIDGYKVESMEGMVNGKCRLNQCR